MDSTSSKSVEHIIPESLWNTQHVLPRGVVCDACNNYFAREIEKPFLDSPAVARLRFTQVIPNKRGRVPTSEAVLQPGFPAVLHRNPRDPHILSVDLEPDGLRHIANLKSGELILAGGMEMPPQPVTSRFLAKMALEAMAYKLLAYPDGIAYLVDEPQLDLIRNFARRGVPRDWPHHIRRIYDSERLIIEPDGRSVQTVHEFDLLVTKSREWFFVFALFGVELVINLGGPEIDGYVAWLQEHDEQSPLYVDRSENWGAWHRRATWP